MYIEKKRKNIAKILKICYTVTMKNVFENKMTYNQISFCYARKASIEEREIHTYHEMLYYIDGDATFLSDTFQEQLEPNCLLFIPKEQFHFFQLKSPNNFTRLKISFHDSEIVKQLFPADLTHIRIIKNINNRLSCLIERIRSVLEGQNEDKKSQILLYGAFIMLLAELAVENSELITPKLRKNNHLISSCLQYIDANLAEDIRIEKIAHHLSISNSTLLSTFKNELGVSLHRYITEKRMILARKLIDNGCNPTKIFSDCGYHDYSSFYKAYIKMFGHSPSCDKSD